LKHPIILVIIIKTGLILFHDSRRKEHGNQG
jgi:hypothetical protein